jgi:RimJ/RimL family protein N-acetyltransferase
LTPGGSSVTLRAGRTQPVLHGERITLRPAREADLDALYAAHADIRNRGAFFPLGVMSETRFRREFGEHGFWQQEEGMLLIVGPGDEIAGHVEFSGRSATGTPGSCRTSSTTTASRAEAT